MKTVEPNIDPAHRGEKIDPAFRNGRNVIPILYKSKRSELSNLEYERMANARPVIVGNAKT